LKSAVIGVLSSHGRKISNPREIDALLQAFRDTDANVRANAFLALVNAADPRITDLAYTSLQDVNPAIRQAALEKIAG
jgi:HEAT repeat protein